MSDLLFRRLGRVPVDDPDPRAVVRWFLRMTELMEQELNAVDELPPEERAAQRARLAETIKGLRGQLERLDYLMEDDDEGQ